RARMDGWWTLAVRGRAVDGRSRRKRDRYWRSVLTPRAVLMDRVRRSSGSGSRGDSGPRVVGVGVYRGRSGFKSAFESRSWLRLRLVRGSSQPPKNVSTIAFQNRRCPAVLRTVV